MHDEPATQAWVDLLLEETAPVPSVRPLLGEVLVAKGLISEGELHEALGIQRREGGRLGEILVTGGALTLPQLMAAVSEQCGIAREPETGLRSRLARRRA